MVAAEVLSGCRQSDTHSNTNVTKSAVTMDGLIAGSREEVYKNERMKKRKKEREHSMCLPAKTASTHSNCTTVALRIAVQSKSILWSVKVNIQWSFLMCFNTTSQKHKKKDPQWWWWSLVNQWAKNRLKRYSSCGMVVQRAMTVAELLQRLQNCRGRTGERKVIEWALAMAIVWVRWTDKGLNGKEEWEWSPRDALPDLAFALPFRCHSC